MNYAGQAVVAFTRRQITKTLGGAMLLGGSRLIGHITQAFAARRDGPSAVPPGFLATLTLFNTGRLLQPAGVPTQTFGWVFKPGDIPVGTAPVFAANGVRQPFSAGLQSYWPDGSLKFATFMLLPTFRVLAGQSQQVAIAKGGTWPYPVSTYNNPAATASGRSLAELYAAKIVYNAPLYPIAGNGRRGSTATLSGWLNGDSNQYKVLKWLDGAAGTGWKISCYVAAGEGGAKDGMLTVDHYVIAVNNGTGGLGGFRWLGALRQPFYNQTGQANNSPGTYIWFAKPSTSSPASGVNFQSAGPGGSGTVTTPLPWLGNDGKTFDTVNFSCPGGGSGDCRVAGGGSNNWYMGAGGPGNASSCLPVVFQNIATPQGSGWLSKVITNGFAFAYTDQSGAHPNQVFNLINQGNFSYANMHRFKNSFTGTAIPTPCLCPFTELMFATEEGKYNFIQAAGSISAETTVLAQIDQLYWQGSGVLPPWNTSIRGRSGFGNLIGPAAVAEIDFRYAWYPYQTGPMPTQQPGVGDHVDIGILPTFAVNDFYNQTQNADLMNRKIGMFASCYVNDFTDKVADYRLNQGNPAKAYSGAAGTMPANNRISGYNPTFATSDYAGFHGPIGTSAIGVSLSLGEHEPTWSVWAYLRTGELQYLDLMVNQTVTMVTLGTHIVNSSNAGTTGTYYATNYSSGGEWRTIAWNNTHANWVAHLYPFQPGSAISGGTTSPSNPVFSDGINLAQYLWDSAEACVGWPLDQARSSLIPWTRWAQANGAFTPYLVGYNFCHPTCSSRNVFASQGGFWEQDDFIASMCLGAARGSAAAAEFLTNVAMRLYLCQKRTIGFWGCSANQGPVIYNPATLATDNYQAFLTSGLIDADHKYMTGISQLVNGGCSISWSSTPSSSGNHFIVSNTPNGWVPTNGDVWNFFGGSGSPGGFTPDTAYYETVNVTRVFGHYEYNLRPYGGGMVVVPTNSGSFSTSTGNFQPAHHPPLNNINIALYIANKAYPIFWMAALAGAGITPSLSGIGAVDNLTTPLGDMYHRFVNSTNRLSPTYYFVNNGVPDARYCVQPSFARLERARRR